MSNELIDFGRRMSTLTDRAAVERIARKAGTAGKKAALDAAAHDLGGDRTFSGMRRRVQLSAGYDDVGQGRVQINFRPAGLWRLAESGRERTGRIYPRAGNRKGRGVTKGRAVRTPMGPRARSSFMPSRGLDTFTDAVKDARREVPKAAIAQLRDEIRRVVR